MTSETNPFHIRNKQQAILGGPQPFECNLAGYEYMTGSCSAAKHYLVSKFDKTYAYSICHSFGKEGKHTDYTPYSCMKIILCNPLRQGDHHGCPFRHSDPGRLKQKLQSYNIPTNGINQVLDLVKGISWPVRNPCRPVPNSVPYRPGAKAQNWYRTDLVPSRYCIDSVKSHRTSTHKCLQSCCMSAWLHLPRSPHHFGAPRAYKHRLAAVLSIATSEEHNKGRPALFYSGIGAMLQIGRTRIRVPSPAVRCPCMWEPRFATLVSEEEAGTPACTWKASSLMSLTEGGLEAGRGACQKPCCCKQGVRYYEVGRDVVKSAPANNHRSALFKTYREVRKLRLRTENGRDREKPGPKPKRQKET
ncbi:PRI2 primase, partial [Polyodon spathula]|nr:PRI2 primase [Polyodon spathula]